MNLNHRETEALDALCDLLIKDQAFTEVAVFGMSEPDVVLALKQPWVSFDNDSQGTAPDGVLGQKGSRRAAHERHEAQSLSVAGIAAQPDVGPVGRKSDVLRSSAVPVVFVARREIDKTRRSHLAHAHPQPTVCSGRRRPALGRLTAP